MPRTHFSRRITTFHDLFFMSGDYSTPDFRQRFTRLAREAAERADLIICVSAFTAGQVASLLGVARDRLRVIHHGVHLPASLTAPREPVVLHVGAIQRRKNVPVLIEAFEEAAPHPWRLVLAGGTGYGAGETLSRIERSPARDRIEMTGWIPDEALQQWYRRVSVFAFPSLDEGFGIPVLEAMAHGLPVICSNRSALPEVYGDAAMPASPNDPAEWAFCLRQLMAQQEERQAWGQRGRARAAEFSWAKAVERTWAVYRELGA